MRIYVMTSIAVEQERLLQAERLLLDTQRRHGLPETHHLQINPIIVDRFLTAFLPEAREGEPAPRALEYAFTPTLFEALDLVRGVVTESPKGRGAAVYIHDLDTGLPLDET
jgi:hypothetical protein